VGIRGRLRKVESAAEEKMIVIPQRDGTVRRFLAEEGMKAYMNLFDRLGAGEDAPPEHPLIEAVRNSTDSEWTWAFYTVNDPDEWIKAVPDLSE
jgi:hypothetical protein